MPYETPTGEPDILVRLWTAMRTADPETRALLAEAMETIKTLRLLVGIREEIELEGIEPEGHA